MQKGQEGIYHRFGGGAVPAVVRRVRGAGQVDIEVGGLLLQQVDQGTQAGQFLAHGHTPLDAPPPALPARLVPRYVPAWHLGGLIALVSALAATVTSFAWWRFLQ